MSYSNGRAEPVFATPGETQAIKQLDKILNSGSSQTLLVGIDGEEIVIPDSVCSVLRQVIELMASGKAAFLVPLEHELTTQEAAELLNVSRPFLVKLLEEGAMPYKMVGTHRRIQFEDLMAYKQQRDEERRASLKRLTQLSEDLGLYNDDFDQEDFEQA